MFYHRSVRVLAAAALIYAVGFSVDLLAWHARDWARHEALTDCFRSIDAPMVADADRLKQDCWTLYGAH